ncbi:MAG: HEAT repeat domain-containing protein, partial [Candidatus Nealsonbacteria bacterium]|nr:HEAT repeat domain-containing protein [Candidatus Nealsonbacteria bacterium]
TYNLGSTGLRGWIYTKPAAYLDSVQGRTTAASRQILVTHVGAKSPADGVMQVDDIILGVGGKLFSDDARKSIARGIQESEKDANRGILKLTRWRSGETEEVQLKLNVMGTYSDTAPYDCPKSKRIFEEACAALEKERLELNLWGAINGLALMSTGNPDYLPKVREFARKLGASTLRPRRQSMGTWEIGYQNIFLCEYYLLTDDEEVLPAIRNNTTAMASGQGMYGTFGHGFSELTPDGKLHGSIPPYGPVNAAGLVANIAIVMGKKCGLKDPEIDPAIERASKFFGYYVDKGAIPYGEHEPWPYHENNGKNAMTALLFALQGDRIEETQFFAKMCTASYRNREYGHTGQGFSYLWGALGANTGGPAAAAAFCKEASWHLDLVRRCDGSFTYDGGEQYGAGRTDDNTYYGKSSYNGLSPTATYVLTYSLPLKQLYITGKNANQKKWLSKKDVAEAIASGRFDLARKTKSIEELIAALGDWSPIVRGWAAEELAKRPEANATVPRLIKLAEGPDVHVCQGACEALGQIKAVEALPVFIRLLTHEDRWLRFKAAAALKNMGSEARPVVRGMLKAVAQTAEPLQPIGWDDPIQLTHGQLGAALFNGPLAGSLKEVDPQLAYPAVRVISRNADGMARATLRNYFENRLTLEDVQALGPDIVAAIRTPSPADTMFSNEIRMGGFKALTKYHFKEGLEAGVILCKTQGGHGSESRTGRIMEVIVSYGTAAREVIPQLREVIDMFNLQCENREFPAGELNDRRVGAVEEAIKTIEAATNQPELRTIAPSPPKGNSTE